MIGFVRYPVTEMKVKQKYNRFEAQKRFFLVTSVILTGEEKARYLWEAITNGFPYGFPFYLESISKTNFLYSNLY